MVSLMNRSFLTYLPFVALNERAFGVKKAYVCKVCL